MSESCAPIGIVTATTNPTRARACIGSWFLHATEPEMPMIIIANGGDDPQGYLGVVPAFRRGVDDLIKRFHDIEIIACFHDDLEIQEDGWDSVVRRAFDRHPDLGLAGFGGAIGLGTDALYNEPYDPMQLARIGFRSNLVDAEAHGARSLTTEPVVCLDGFSQIGRRAFFTGLSESEWRTHEIPARTPFRHVRPWTYLERLGFIHHFYDGALGCLARRLGWQVRYLPVRCRHYGGQTAVGDPGYQRWAALEIDGGDRGFWEAAHRIGYAEFKDVLPLRL
jgi:hypothetical protein